MSPHILIVDDDPAIRETLAEVLAEEGYTVTSATNGAEALAAIERALPDLVLLDMRMPVLDGPGLARALDERGLAPPILVMTAAQEAHDWVEQLAAARTLAKPFNLDELLRAVASALRVAYPDPASPHARA